MEFRDFSASPEAVDREAKLVLPKWVYPILILFVVFFILSNPDDAGPQAKSFFGWLGDQAGATGTFLDGLFGDDAPPSNGGTTPTTIDSTGTTPDSFNTIGPIVIIEPLTI